MGVNFSPIAQSTSKNSQNVLVAGTTTATYIPVNEARLGGYITNNGNRTMFVKFGDAASGNALTAAAPFTAVPAGANIDVPEFYVGAIGLIWATGVSTTSNAVFTEFLP
jgi:hypothetical protein